MKKAITVMEIKANVLSAKTLALVSEFALILYRYNGTVIDVHAEDVLYRVLENASKVDLPRLNAISREIKSELEHKSFKTNSVSVSPMPPQQMAAQSRPYRKL